MNKFNVKYFSCNNCSYLFTEKPYWLNEAYSRSINVSDTGLLIRNIEFSKILSVLIYFNFDKEAKFLDYAGGYGVFTRLMRDVGFDFYWHDQYTKNLLAEGFEFDNKEKDKFELLTAFEVFEHLVNPIEELDKMLQYSNTVIFSTQLIHPETPPKKDWWYYGFYHGQHISFYSSKTFNTLAEKFKIYYINADSFHLFSKKKLNKSKVTMLTKMRNYGLFNFVKKKMHSKTFEDHMKFKEKDLA